jgi:hypothetical protein
MLPARATTAGQVTPRSCTKVTMRSENQMTWGWSDILLSTGFTDAALRRQTQRKQVEFEAPAVNCRTRATIWDVARLRMSRDFGSRGGMEPSTAFGLARSIIELAYTDLIEDDRKLTGAKGTKQRIVFAFWLKSDSALPSPRLIRVDPNNTKDCARAFKELALQATDPQNAIYPVHFSVLSAWSKLPGLPDDLQAWIAASREKMTGIFA